VRRAAAIYNVSYTTLSDRRAGKPSRADTIPNLSNLTKPEEDIIIEYVLDLIKRGFPPRLADIANIANSLRAKRNLGQVSIN
jgi:hypothetical protein